VQSTAGLSGVRSAFELISNLPFIEVKNKVIDVPVPDLSPEDMSKYQKSQENTLSKWNKELAQTKADWTKLGSGTYYQNAIGAGAGGLISSLQYNQRMVGEYAKFPQKLATLFAWKEKYTKQITCNLDAVENLMGKWMENNGKRFKSWVQAFQLLKKALETWQVIPDLFKNYKASCSVCRNERYDLKHFMFKLVSVLTPKIPIIQFPKWPDIILDLHDVQLGMTITMPQFNIRSVPIQLPQLPSLNLPSVPNLSVGLPNLPKLPSIPTLPTLPDLPSIPLVKLPDLPPPPKIPNIFGSISGVLNILKIWQKIMCIFRTNPFAPEWRAGDLIAQLTERSGTLSIDFLDLEFPKISLSFADALRVKTSLNFDFKSDFLAQMAQAIVAPLRQFTPDLTHRFSGTSSSINPLGSSSGNANIKLNYNETKSTSGSGKTLGAVLKETKDSDTWLVFWSLGMIRGLSQYVQQELGKESDVKEFAAYFATQLDALPVTEDATALALQKSAKEALKEPADTKEMLKAKQENAERFTALKDYLNQEILDAQRLQQEIKGINKLQTADQILAGALNSSSFIASELAMEKQNKVNALAQKGKDQALSALNALVLGETTPSTALSTQSFAA